MSPVAQDSQETLDGLPRRPLLPGIYHVVPAGPDRVQISNAGRHVMLRGDGLAEQVGPLLAALDGTATIDELASRFPGIVADVLTGLQAKGLLTDAGVPADGAGSSPQLAALSVPSAPSPAEAVGRLATATVALAGCGPVGATVAVLLGKAGVGRLLLADGDPVSSKDVATSPVLAPPAEGAERASAVLGLCAAATGAAAEVVDEPFSSHIPDGVDLVLVEVGYEGEDAASLVADACLAGGHRYLLYTQDALEAVVGPLVGAGGAPCHRCTQARRMSHVTHLDEHLAYRRHRTAASPRADTMSAAGSSVVAGIVAHEVLRALLDASPTTAGAALVVDLASLTIEREEVLPVPGCPACLTAPDGGG